MARPIKATPRLSAKQFKELGEKLDANTEHKELVMVDNEVKPPETVDRIVMAHDEIKKGIISITRIEYGSDKKIQILVATRGFKRLIEVDVSPLAFVRALTGRVDCPCDYTFYEGVNDGTD